MDNQDDDRIPLPSEFWANRLLPSRRAILGGIAATGVSLAASRAARPEEPLRVGIGFSDFPRLHGGPEGGFAGMRFAGYPIYDALINWDLESGDHASGLVPGLAESWHVDPADPSRWIVTLRQGVKFHDGSSFDADAALWNYASIFDDKSPQFSAPRVAQILPRLPSILGAKKIDDRTIAILTRGADAMAPYQFSFLLIVSPTQFAKLGNDWDKFAAQPSGTGPFRVAALVPRTRLDLMRNDAYWDTKRIPKSPGVTLVPILDANARIAALRAGQIDLAEAIPPDAIDSLKAAGLQIRTNVYPGILKWSLSYLPDSPFADLRVRRAANLAIDRDGLVKLLNGLAQAAKGFVPTTSPWFGHPSFALRYDPAEAKKLLAEAGFGPGKPVKTKILMAATGGGQVEPSEVNEFVQSNLAAVGIEVEFQVLDYVALFGVARGGAKAPSSAGINGMYLEGPTQDPTSFFLRGYASDLTPPQGSNWGYYNNPKVDDALHVARQTFEPAAFDKAMAKVNELMVDDAAALMLAHGLACWGMSGKAKNFVIPQNWFVNLTSVSMT